MSAKTRRKKKVQRRRKNTAKPRPSRYTPTEWFLVALGAAMVIFFAGILITALLG